MSLVSLLKGRRGDSGFGYASTAEEVTRGIDLRGRTILVTGANSGLGRESARVLASRGARVVAAVRTLEKARECAAALGNHAVPLACELSEPNSVRAAVTELKKQNLQLDVILCNAGIMAVDERQVRHGHELQFLTNHLGHFILVTGLLDLLRAHGRVVMLSSDAHHWAPPGGIQFDDPSFANGYDKWKAYGQSKLANLLFARALARRLAGSSRTANAVHPGVIKTNLGRHMSAVQRVGMSIAGAVAFKSIAEGAATQCFVATHPSLDAVTGEYFADCNVHRSSRAGRDAELAERLWTVSEQIVAAL